ncbi:MAG: hypothetical protein IPK69_06400 [Phycisphaerales bacterium]|nr:MAG: hypothetical protein IPK69_06400 [Phycisphaerales bacterium]
MTQSGPPAVEKNSPLEAAQKIVTELQGMTSENQSLALQFAMQTLRITPPSAHLTPSPGPAHPDAPIVHAAADVPSHPTDIKSFTAAKAPRSDQQFAAVVAYFYQFEAPTEQHKDSIDAATMKDAARLAVWGQVRNWNTTLKNAMRAGYLDRAERGAFKLSSVGENLVAITLPGSGATSAGNSGGTKGRVSKKKVSTKKRTKKGG